MTRAKNITKIRICKFFNITTITSHSGLRGGGRPRTKQSRHLSFFCCCHNLLLLSRSSVVVTIFCCYHDLLLLWQSFVVITILYRPNDDSHFSNDSLYCDLLYCFHCLFIRPLILLFLFIFKHNFFYIFKLSTIASKLKPNNSTATINEFLA